MKILQYMGKLSNFQYIEKIFLWGFSGKFQTECSTKTGRLV